MIHHRRYCRTVSRRPRSHPLRRTVPAALTLERHEELVADLTLEDQPKLSMPRRWTYNEEIREKIAKNLAKLEKFDDQLETLIQKRKKLIQKREKLFGVTERLFDLGQNWGALPLRSVDKKPKYRMARKDVGMFAKNASIPGSELLCRPRGSFNKEQENRMLVRAVRSLPLPPGLKKNHLLDPFWSLHCNCLNLVAPSRRQSLMNLLDEHFAESASVDVKVDLEKEELVSYIGSNTYKELERLFCSELGGSPNAFLVRRVSTVKLHIAFHQDHALRTMQVALNDDYCGGRLAFVEKDPTGSFLLVQPERPAGTITCHNNGVVHGVTRFESGVRYSLFLLQK